MLVIISVKKTKKEITCTFAPQLYECVTYTVTTTTEAMKVRQML